MAHFQLFRRPILLILLVLLLGYLANIGMTEGFDQHLLPLLVLQKGQSPDWLISATQLISWIGGGIQRYIIVGLLGALLWWWRSWQYGLAMIGASLLSNFASNALKSGFGRPRPSLVPHLDHVDSASFPSGHATSAAAVYLLMIWLVPEKQRKYWLWPMLALFLLTGFSRPMLGVHYPSDVIGGWMLGAAFALAAVTLVRMFKGAE